MNKRSVQVLACLFSASMLAMTGCGGAAATTEADTTETETIEYAVEENESCTVNTSSFGTFTKYDSLFDLMTDLPKDASTEYGSTLRPLKGYDGDVLIVTDNVVPGFNSPNATSAKFYTQKEGEKVRLAGELRNDSGSNSTIKYDGEVIYLTTPTTYETYLISKDGTRLEHKDYVEKNSDGSYWGYLNEYTEEDERTDFTGGEAEFNELMAKVNGKDGKGRIPALIFTKVNDFDSSRHDIGERITKYDSFDELIEDLPRDSETSYGYANLSVKNYYDGEVLAVTNDCTRPDGVKQARFYTQQPGEKVRCIGVLSTGGTAYTLKISDDNIIYASNPRSFETYLVSSDGKNLEHKDYIYAIEQEDNTSYWGYLNDSYEKSTRVEFDGSSDEYAKRYHELYDNPPAKNIQFTPVK